MLTTLPFQIQTGSASRQHQIKIGETVDNLRYDYDPIVARRKIEWPNKAPVAFWICPNIEYFHIDKPILESPNPTVPEISAYSLRDYGARVGVFRMMEVFDKHGIRASVLLNSDACDRYPFIIEEGMKRNWEWLGHGITNNLRLTSYPKDDEIEVIRKVKDTITKATGMAPKGWLGPALAESFETPDLLASEGFEYVCDWVCDDQPTPMRVRQGRMLVVPYDQGLNDIRVFMRGNHTPAEYCQMLCDQFDTLFREGEKSGRVMGVPLHPFVIGLPFRIKYLDNALEYIFSHKGVWRATGGEIADWYYRNYYEDPGKYPVKL